MQGPTVLAAGGGTRSLGPTYEAANGTVGRRGRGGARVGSGVASDGYGNAQAAVGPAQAASIAAHAIVLTHDVDPAAGQR